MSAGWLSVLRLTLRRKGTDAGHTKRCLDEAVQLWFESCIERGTLEQALQELNFRPQFRVI